MRIGRLAPNFIAGQSETGSPAGDVLRDASRGVQNYAAATKKQPGNPLAEQLIRLQIENATINVARNKRDFMAESAANNNERKTLVESYGGGQDKVYTYPHAETKQFERTKIVGEHKARKLVQPDGTTITIGAHASAEDFQKWFGEWVGDAYGIWAWWRALQGKGKEKQQ